MHMFVKQKNQNREIEICSNVYVSEIEYLALDLSVAIVFPTTFDIVCQ